MNDATRFGVYCGLTCLGGIEKRTCACTDPNKNCELRQKHPRFWTYRALALARMIRLVRDEMREKRLKEMRGESLPRGDA